MKRTKSDPPQARKPYTPPATQNRIFEEHLNGKSNRQIAKMIGLDRGTVSRILSLPEMVEIIEEQRSRLFEEASPKVVSATLKFLDSDDLRIAPFVLELGDRMGIIPKRPLAAEPERDRERDRAAALGYATELVMGKSVRFSMPLTPRQIEDWRCVLDYVEKILEASEAGGPGAALASTEGRDLDSNMTGQQWVPPGERLSEP